MKRISIIALMIFTCISASPQKGIESIFDKYASEDGYVSVSISGNLLRFSSCEDEDKSIPSDISEIRIIEREDKSVMGREFLESVMKSVDSDDYEEFMKIKNTDSDVRIFVRTKGKSITELLLVAAGDDNALIRLKGNITFSEARRFSEDIKSDKLSMTGNSSGD